MNEVILKEMLKEFPLNEFDYSEKHRDLANWIFKRGSIEKLHEK